MADHVKFGSDYREAMLDPDRFQAAADLLKSHLASADEDFLEVRKKVIALAPIQFIDQAKPKNGYVPFTAWVQTLISSRPALESEVQNLIPWAEMKEKILPPDAASVAGAVPNTMSPPPQTSSGSRTVQPPPTDLVGAIQSLTAVVASLQKRMDDMSAGAFPGPQSPPVTTFPITEGRYGAWAVSGNPLLGSSPVLPPPPPERRHSPFQHPSRRDVSQGEQRRGGDC